MTLFYVWDILYPSQMVVLRKFGSNKIIFAGLESELFYWMRETPNIELLRVVFISVEFYKGQDVISILVRDETESEVKQEDVCDL